MKRTVFLMVLAALCLLPCKNVKAQNITVPEGYEIKDSLVYRQTANVDSTLVGRNVFNMPGSSRVTQSTRVEQGMNAHINQNRTKSMTGYRVRIFFDNKQNSRQASQDVLQRFCGMNPGIPAYRSFTTPFFKVTVGDFRTRSEAMQLLQSIAPSFPSAFVVRETINYPTVDKEHSYIVDTLRIVRKKND